ncbi:MAG: DUF3108 domain-containing protein [Pseudomonadota bacterium]
MKRPVCLLTALYMAFVPYTALASERAAFDIFFGSLRAGLLIFAAETRGSAYAVRGELRPSPLVASFSDGRFAAEARGESQDGRFRPNRYSEEVRAGASVSNAELRYAAGVPRLERYDRDVPPDVTPVDPASQGGTVDPMTAIYALLRTVPDEEICGQDFATFDGVRRSEVAVEMVAVGEEGAECEGTYTRVAGYSPEDLSQRRSFPFRLSYDRAEDGRFTLAEMRIQTLFGAAKLIRR